MPNLNTLRHLLNSSLHLQQPLLADKKDQKGYQKDRNGANREQQAQEIEPKPAPTGVKLIKFKEFPAFHTLPLIQAGLTAKAATIASLDLSIVKEVGVAETALVDPPVAVEAVLDPAFDTPGGLVEPEPRDALAAS